ncbi:hypothetical protein JCM10212_003364 [Sporobolomyces blumeae]
MTKITLHYDVVSPWSLFAYHILKRYRKAWNYELVLKPMFLGGVMNASGNKPPLTVKNKGIWMNKHDMPLFSEMSDIPYTFPETFPFNTIQCMRFLRAVEQLYPDKLEKATDLFWTLVWQRPQGETAKSATDLSTFPFKFVDRGILTRDEVDKVVEASQSTENKDRLKREAEALVNDKGAFGFPWIEVERRSGETRAFFGTDRFEQIAYWLGEKWDGPKGPSSSSSSSSKL